MDKQSKAYDDLFKQIIPPSPLEQAFKNWRETTKSINEERKEKEQHTGPISSFSDDLQNSIKDKRKKRWIINDTNTTI